jgi:hypothetical protein
MLSIRFLRSAAVLLNRLGSKTAINQVNYNYARMCGVQTRLLVSFVQRMKFDCFVCASRLTAIDSLTSP